MKYISLFSGIGGFEYGINKATNSKWKCVGFSEVDKYATAIYSYNFKSTNFGDATTIDTDSLPTFDFLCAGFPCQAFSIAGKRKGFDDTRGTLFFEIARILEAKEPAYFLIENVKGLLNHQQGKTFTKILQTLDELGYNLQWMVLNSKFFGVPQNRERVFIIGYLREKSKRKILSFREDAEKISRLHGDKNIKIRKLPSNSPNNFNIGELESMGDGGHNVSMVVDTARCLDSNMFRGTTPEYFFEKKRRNIIPVALRGRYVNKKSQQIEEQKKEYINSLTGVQKDSLIAHSVRSGGRCSVDRHSWDIYEVDYKLRRLTPIECERLQGFPDDWTKYGLFDGEVKEISDTQRYKCLGNTITTNVIEAIVKKLW